MNERFRLEWDGQVDSVVDDLVEIVDFAEELLIDAFSSCADASLSAKSVTDVKNLLRWIVMGGGIPWVFFDTVSALVKRLPQGAREQVLEKVRIPTRHPNEYLTVTEDGRWQLAWIVPRTSGSQDESIALDWYSPPYRDKSPIVPEAVLDYVAGCITLLNGNLVLPAGAVLSIALEAVIWDALELEGITRLTDKIKYKAVEWEMQKASSSLVVKINGADKDLGDLGKATGNYPPKFTLRFRRMQAGEGQQKITLQAEADASLLGHLTTSEEDQRESSAQHGLSVAIQRGRKGEIDSLNTTIPPNLDRMLVPLRNNLIHLIPVGDLNEPIPTSEGEIKNLDDLRANERLIRTLLPWILELINSVYSGQLELEFGEIPNSELLA